MRNLQTVKLKSPPNKLRIRYILPMQSTYIRKYISTAADAKTLASVPNA